MQKNPFNPLYWRLLSVTETSYFRKEMMPTFLLLFMYSFMKILGYLNSFPGSFIFKMKNHTPQPNHRFTRSSAKRGQKVEWRRSQRERKPPNFFNPSSSVEDCSSSTTPTALNKPSSPTTSPLKKATEIIEPPESENPLLDFANLILNHTALDNPSHKARLDPMKTETPPPQPSVKISPLKSTITPSPLITPKPSNPSKSHRDRLLSPIKPLSLRHRTR